MQFLQPLFLIALSAIALPIIIHLFYFRRYRKVYFTNVQFLKEVKEESSIRSRLKNLLILLARILAVIFLVLAFAQPFLQKSDEVQQGKKVVSIFIDNSYSMASLGQATNLLEMAKRHAQTITEAYELTDDIQIVTHNFQAKQQRLINKEEAVNLIQEIDLTAATHQLDEVLTRQLFALQQSDADNQVIYWITDFQKSICDFPIAIDSSINLNLVPLYPVIEKNLSIDSVWFEAPVHLMNQTDELFVKIRNWGQDPVENAKISMTRGEQVQAIGTVSIPGLSSVIDTVKITALSDEWQQIKLQISDFPVQFDDAFFLTYPIVNTIQLLHIHEQSPNPYLLAAIDNENYFQSTSVSSNRLDFGQFSDYQLIILDELPNIASGLSTALENYVRNGGNVIVFPSAQSNLDDYNLLLSKLNAGKIISQEDAQRTVASYNRNEFIFKDVFDHSRAALKLPSTVKNYLFQFGRSPHEQLMTYRDGLPFMVKCKRDNGHLYVLAAPIDVQYNNLVNQAEIFVPLIYKSAVSKAQQWQLAYSIGQNEAIEVENRKSNSDQVYQIEGEINFIPAQRNNGPTVVLQDQGQIQEPGFYTVTDQNEEFIAALGYNFNRKESDLSFYNVNELKERFSDQVQFYVAEKQTQLAQLIKEKNQGVVLWRYCLILALIFLALEALIIRFWKN